MHITTSCFTLCQIRVSGVQANTASGSDNFPPQNYAFEPTYLQMYTCEADWRTSRVLPNFVVGPIISQENVTPRNSPRISSLCRRKPRPCVRKQQREGEI
ncbi:hypothetical protein ILYODFUR_010366 [Ilyodon furcidens]|uniref:Uncharacterized protein n=2 Tax=Goodeidae TaxID=28758 RepID=A0ABV0T6U7_9TELE